MSTRLHLCTQCGAETSAPVLAAPGNGWITLALAIPFVIPAVVYTVWRYTSRRPACPTCGHKTLIPASAPLARTWRSMGWTSPRLTDSGTMGAEGRLERIEQAIDAIASEVDRVAQVQRFPSHSLSEPGGGGSSRERGSRTPA
jgi:rRNA maturation protein Nop10